ncbi:MAG: hypothetical protein ACRD3Q_14060 [Terriglobales bacterium]
MDNEPEFPALMLPVDFFLLLLGCTDDCGVLESLPEFKYALRYFVTVISIEIFEEFEGRFKLFVTGNNLPF